MWCLEERQEPGCSVQKWGPEQGGGTRGGCSANDWGGQLPVRVPAKTGLAPEERRTAGSAPVRAPRRPRFWRVAPRLRLWKCELRRRAVSLASLWSLHVWLRAHVSLVGGRPLSKPSNAGRSSSTFLPGRKSCEVESSALLLPHKALEWGSRTSD